MTTNSATPDRDGGFGLVEIMVSMVIFALLLAAAIPLFITTIRVTSKNMSVAHATQLVSEGIEAARSVAVTGSCTNVSDALANLPDSTDGRGITFDVSGVMSGCNPANPTNLVTVTVSATTTSTGFTNPVATATSQIFVKFTP